MTIKDMVADRLRKDGMDGLCNTFDCGCRLDDLMPCGEPHPSCIAGRIRYGKFDHGTDWIIEPVAADIGRPVKLMTERFNRAAKRKTRTAAIRAAIPPNGGLTGTADKQEEASHG